MFYLLRVNTLESLYISCTCTCPCTVANINVWVLTGDKEETAINIAVACNLVLPAEYMEQVVINKNTATDIDKARAIFVHQIQQHLEHAGDADWKPRALIIGELQCTECMLVQPTCCCFFAVRRGACRLE